MQELKSWTGLSVSRPESHPQCTLQFGFLYLSGKVTRAITSYAVTRLRTSLSFYELKVTFEAIHLNNKLGQLWFHITERDSINNVIDKTPPPSPHCFWDPAYSPGGDQPNAWLIRSSKVWLLSSVLPQMVLFVKDTKTWIFLRFFFPPKITMESTNES